MYRMKRNIIYMVCATALLSSCHIYKAYDRPEDISAEDIYRDPASDNAALQNSDTTNMGNLPWQEIFTDPKLQALIEEGLENNVDLQAAILRVEESKALLTSARLSFLPSINLAPQGTITSMGGSTSNGGSGFVKAYSLPATASWDVDLFGKLLNASRQQRTAYLQSQFSQQAVRSQIICGIANSYYTLLMLDRQLEITSETVDIYEETVSAMEAMKEAAMRLASQYGTRVLLKGGHLPGNELVDVLGGDTWTDDFHFDKITSSNLHGTGCTLSSAIAAYLAAGFSTCEAITHGEDFTRTAIRAGRDLRFGHGNGPLWHFFSLDNDLIWRKPLTLQDYKEDDILII